MRSHDARSWAIRRAMLACAVAALAGACGASQPEPSEPEPPPAPVTTPAPSPPAAANPPGAIRSTYTGQPRPTLTIENAYPVTQHIFVDGTEVGTVPQGQSATFDVPTGQHVIIAADSGNPSDNPASASETFRVGWAYAYRVSGN